MVASQELRIRFVTRLDDEQYARGGGIELVVPHLVKRKGLNDILRQLLELAEEDKRGFDFLVDGVVLRGELGQLAQQKGYGVERTVEVEYSLRGSKVQAEEDQVILDDWIAHLDTCAGPKGNVLIAAGTYDGNLIVMDGVQIRSQLKVSQAPIKGVQWLDPRTVATVASDGILRLISIKEKGNALHLLLTGAASDGQGLESVEFTSNGERVCVGSVSGNAYVFETSRELNEALLEIREVKRRKSSAKDPIIAVPCRDLEGHTMTVSCLEKLPDDNKIISGSWDGAASIWDLETAERIRTIPTLSKSITDISVRGDTVAVACMDGAVRLLDLRTNDAAPIQSIRRAHRLAAAALQWRPESDYEIASAGFDSAVKLWDIRATSGVSYKKIAAHGEDGKATTLSWEGLNTLVSGGSDGQIRMFNFR